MRKILTYLLVVMLLAQCIPFVAMAAEPATFAGNTVNSKPGATDKVTFNVSGEFTSFTMSMNYNANVLTNGKVINESGFGNVDFYNGKVIFYNPNGNTNSFRFSLQFDVAADAKADTYYVTPVHIDDFYNAEKELITPAITAGAIVIPCDHANKKLNQGDDEYHWYDCECGVIGKEKHTFGELTDNTATCGQPGTAKKTCTVCGKVVTVDTEATGNHNYVKDEEASYDATCIKPGYIKSVCSVCGDVKEEYPTATGKHNYVRDNAVSYDATCGKAGYIKSVCSMCGDVKEEYPAATGKHTYGAWKVIKEATDTKDGLEKRVCSVCGHEQTRVIPHDADDVPGTGDITPMLYATGFGVISLFVAVAYVFKRKFVR